MGGHLVGVWKRLANEKTFMVYQKGLLIPPPKLLCPIVEWPKTVNLITAQSLDQLEKVREYYPTATVEKIIDPAKVEKFIAKCFDKNQFVGNLLPLSGYVFNVSDVLGTLMWVEIVTISSPLEAYMENYEDGS